MPSFHGVNGALRKTLNDLSPSSIIDEGYVTIFHTFFAKGTYNEFMQFKPPTFESEHPRHLRLSPHLQTAPSTPGASQNVSDFTTTIVAGGPNPSFKPTPSIPRIQSRPKRKKRSVDLNVLTPESFKKQKRQDKQISASGFKLIQCIREVVAQNLRDLAFYGTLWGSTEAFQLQNHVTDPVHRYEALQQMISDGAENEVKNIYRQRIAHILGAHELEVIDKSISAGELSKGVKRRTITISKLSESSGKERKEITLHNTRRRHYLSFYFEFGPGAVLLLGDIGNRDLLENVLTDYDVGRVIKYVRNNIPDWLSLCERINFQVATSILKGLLISGWDGISHYETNFMNHLGNFIDLETFRKAGGFRPISVKKTAAELNASALYAGESELATEESERPAEPDATPSSATEPPVQALATRSQPLSRGSTPDSNHLSMVNNLDFDWNLNIASPGPSLATEHAQQRRDQPENLDTGWAQLGETGDTPENLDRNWAQLLQHIEYPSGNLENLDLGWAQLLQDIEHPSKNLDLGWTHNCYAPGVVSR